MTRPLAPLIALIASLAAVPLLAQSLRNHNSRAPVDIEADRIEVQDRADRAVFAGNVRAVQAEMTLTAQRLTVAYSGSAGSSGTQINRLDASGGVTVRSPSENARGNVAIYDLDRRIITMLGAVTLNQNGNTVRGARLVIDLASGRSTMDGGTNGAGGRVSGRFTVPQQQQR